VVVDTGSADLWVLDKDCTTCGTAVPTPPTFDTTLSKTYTVTSQQDTTITYGDGSTVSGPLSSDMVSIGDSNVANQTFCDHPFYISFVSQF
jgi:cathepsin D